LPSGPGRPILLGMDEDLDPRTAKKKLKPLDNYSIDELRDYIQNLKSEIERSEKEIAKKQAHMSAASTLFKTKTGD
jgi:uncharacterized small protein (DUF1192 family)